MSFDTYLKTKLGDNYRKYLDNTVWLLAEKIFRIAVNLFVSVWLARYLGPAGFGSLSFVLTFIFIFSVFYQTAVDGVIIRMLLKFPENSRSVISSAFWIRIGGGITMLAVLPPVWFLMDKTADESIMIIWLIGGAMFQVFYVIDARFQALVLGKYKALSHFGQFVGSSLLKIYLMLIGAELSWFALAYALEHIIQSFMLVYFNRGHNHCLLPRYFSRSIARRILVESFPLMLSSLSIFLYMKLDQVMLKQMVGSAETGMYAAAVRLSESWHFLPMTICGSVFPSIIKAKAVGEQHMHLRLVKLLRLLVGLALSVAAFTTLFSNYFIPLLFGEKYLSSIPILQVHIWGSLFIIFGLVFNARLMSEKLSGIIFMIGLSGLIVNVLLNMLLIPPFGSMGAAVATLFAQFMSCILINVFWKKTRYAFVLIKDALLFTRSR